VHAPKLSADEEWVAAIFAKRMAVLGVRERGENRIRTGLRALTPLKGAIDLRDAIIYLARCMTRRHGPTRMPTPCSGHSVDTRHHRSTYRRISGSNAGSSEPCGDGFCRRSGRKRLHGLEDLMGLGETGERSNTKRSMLKCRSDARLRFATADDRRKPHTLSACDRPGSWRLGGVETFRCVLPERLPGVCGAPLRRSG